MQGQNRSLEEHILCNTEKQSHSSFHDAHDDQDNSIQDAERLEEEDMDVPEMVEEIIELLLSGLRDSVRNHGKVLMSFVFYFDVKLIATAFKISEVC